MSFGDIPYIDPQNNDATLNLSLHQIRLPFPPTFITVSDFVNKRESSSRIFRKSPNAFFIYRKAFTNFLKLNNYKLTMIDVSRLVSSYWKNESKEVKEAYAKIAKEIDIELKEKRKHDKKCPVIWKTDKKSKKQKKASRKNLKNNDSSLIKLRNTAEIMFEFQNCSILVDESDQKILQLPEEMDSQTSLENSPDSSSPIMDFPGIVQGYDVVNYDNSCESRSNESEEENYDMYNQITQIYSLNYDLNNNNLYAQYNWNMNDSCNENLVCQQGNEFH